MTLVVKVALTLVCAGVMLAAIGSFAFGIFALLMGQTSGLTGMALGLVVFALTSLLAPKW